MNPNIVIDSILNARDFLEKSEHEKSFELINEFFENQNKEQPNVLYFQKHLQIIKTRYFRLIKEKEAGIVDYTDYDRVFNQISDALFSFFNSVLHECEKINNKSKAEGIISRPNTVRAVLVFDLKLEDYAEEDILTVVNDIRKILGLKEHEFKYLFTKSGSIIIGVEMLRSYNIGIKLKSLIKVKWIIRLTSFQIQDTLMDQYCLAVSELQLNLSNLFLSYKVKNLGLVKRLDLVAEPQIQYRNLSGANLSGADLRRANLIGADLSGADLSGAKLSGAYLIEADLRRADLRRADLSGADLSGAYLIEANLIGANLIGANLIGAKLSGAKLSGAYLSGAYLIGADLKGADLSGADLSGAILNGAILNGAKLSGAKLSGADLMEADLRKADLRKADLRKADLSEAKLSQANLTNTTTDKTIFNSSHISYLSKMGINLETCIFVDSLGKHSTALV